MKRFSLFLFRLSLMAIFFPMMAYSQSFRMKRSVEFLGWADDSHYIQRTGAIISSIDIKTGKSQIIKESGIPSVERHDTVLLIENDLYLYNEKTDTIERLTSDDVPEVNARLSPDRQKIAYTKNKDLYVFDLASGKEIRLTSDATEKIYNGYASWVYMEEILGRSSDYAAFWWSPDGKKLAFLRTDETDVPVYTLNRADEEGGLHGKVETTPYPKAGDPNPKVRMAVADLTTQDITFIKTDENADLYLAWPFWTPDSKKLAIQVINRDQTENTIILADPSTGDFTQIYIETRKTWVDFFQDIYVMKNGTGFILKSFADGFDNLYYYNWDGRLRNRITNFRFVVNSIDRVDEKAGLIYFTATGAESTDRQFFRAGLDGSNVTAITKGSGTHRVYVSPKGSYFVDVWNDLNTPLSVFCLDKNGKVIRETDRQEADKKSGSNELVRIETSDGLFSMPAIISYPLDFDPSRKYPVVFTVYGGPDMQNVQNEWQGRYSWYAQNDIIRFTVDHRGSGHFGRYGTDFLYRNLGKWEMLDYIDAVRWLRKKQFVDEKKIGITGSSYGGYVTCLALTKGAGYWNYGFAGSSVTDFRFYDSVYTERYMDMPEDNPEGYDNGSALKFAENYKGGLYLNHGDMDDNVHMQNSLYLVSKLEDLGKSFEFMIYPGQRHGFSYEKMMHSIRESYAFWKRSFFPCM